MLPPGRILILLLGNLFGYKTELKGPFRSDLNKVELWCVALSL